MKLMTQLKDTDGRYLFRDRDGVVYVLHRRGGVFQLTSLDETKYIETCISGSYTYTEAAKILTNDVS